MKIYDYNGKKNLCGNSVFPNMILLPDYRPRAY